jgi:hypothetical protein
MFGRKHADAPAESAALEQDLLATGERTVATVNFARPNDVRDHSVEWHFQVNVSAGGSWHEVEVVQRLPDSYDYRGAGDRAVPVIFDPLNPSRIIVDMAALPEYAARATADAAARWAAQSPGSPPPPTWLLPDHCPNCGAVVDQAMESHSADPKCTFCHEPLPVKPSA